MGSAGTGREKGILKTAAGIIGREVEAAVGQGGKDGDITDRAKGQATKYGYKAGKYAVKGGFAAGRGAIRFAKYGRKLSNDVAAGVLTGSAAKITYRPCKAKPYRIGWLHRQHYKNRSC